MPATAVLTLAPEIRGISAVVCYLSATTTSAAILKSRNFTETPEFEFMAAGIL